jgi:hypothetical protein
MAPLRAAGPSASDLVASRGDICPPTRQNLRFPELIGPLVVMAPAVLHAIFMNQSFVRLYRCAAASFRVGDFRTLPRHDNGAANLDEHSDQILIGRIERDCDVLRASSVVVE